MQKSLGKKGFSEEALRKVGLSKRSLRLGSVCVCGRQCKSPFNDRSWNAISLETNKSGNGKRIFEEVIVSRLEEFTERLAVYFAIFVLFLRLSRGRCRGAMEE